MGRILVGLDASELAPVVLEEAVRHAESSDAKLVLARVVRLPTDMPSSIFALSADSVLDHLRDSARAELHTLATSAPAARIESIEVLVGSPWQALCQRARELDVELIVVGAHSYRALERLIGTTSAKVVNHADRTVLVVRPRPEHVDLQGKGADRL